MLDNSGDAINQQPDITTGGQSFLNSLEVISSNVAYAAGNLGAGRMPYDPGDPNYNAIRPAQQPKSGLAGLLSSPLVILLILWAVFK